jgi:hypothetical protein
MTPQKKPLKKKSQMKKNYQKKKPSLKKIRNKMFQISSNQTTMMTTK